MQEKVRLEKWVTKWGREKWCDISGARKREVRDKWGTKVGSEKVGSKIKVGQR